MEKVFILEKYTAKFLTQNIFMKHTVPTFPHKSGDSQKYNWSKREFEVDTLSISTAETHSNTTKAFS